MKGKNFLQDKPNAILWMFLALFCFCEKEWVVGVMALLFTLAQYIEWTLRVQIQELEKQNSELREEIYKLKTGR